jgi:hypothetical protein
MALEMRDVIGALTEKWRRSGHDIGFGILLGRVGARAREAARRVRFAGEAFQQRSREPRFADPGLAGEHTTWPSPLFSLTNAVAANRILLPAQRARSDPSCAMGVEAAFHRIPRNAAKTRTGPAMPLLCLLVT